MTAYDEMVAVYTAFIKDVRKDRIDEKKREIEASRNAERVLFWSVFDDVQLAQLWDKAISEREFAIYQQMGAVELDPDPYRWRGYLPRVEASVNCAWLIAQEMERRRRASRDE